MANFSIVVPIYNEEVYIETFFKELKKSLKGTSDFELIFVNDGSTDFSGRVLQNIVDNNSFVKLITLDKNYGKQIAITAGMKEAKCDITIIFSVKNTKPYLAINKMISSWYLGHKIVFAYTDKKKNFFSKLWSNFKAFVWKVKMRFFGIDAKIYETPEAELYDRQVVDVLNELPDRQLFLRRVDSFIEYKKADVFYTAPPKEDEKASEIYRKIKTEFDATRIEENIPEPRKIKRRLYASSLWISFASFCAFAVLLLTLAIVYVVNKNNMEWIMLLSVLCLISFVLCIIYYFKSTIIKKFGIMFRLRKGEELYKVKNIQG